MVKAYWKREQEVVVDDVIAMVNAGYAETQRRREQLRRLHEKQEQQEREARRETLSYIAVYIAVMIIGYAFAVWVM